VEERWQVTSNARTNHELDRILLDNPPLLHEILEVALKIHQDLSTNPEGFVDEFEWDGTGRGFVLEALPRHGEFALWVQFTVLPSERLVAIARVELIGPSPPPDSANGHPPS
jgi:hypothetical protein